VTLVSEKLVLAETTQKQHQTQHKLYLYEPDSFVPLAQVENEWDKEDDNSVPDLLNSTYNDPALNQMLQEARNDPFIWRAHVLPLHKRLRQQMGLKDTAPRRQALTSRILYYHTDHLGTPRELTNTDGQIVWATTYKAWGATQRIDYPPILHIVQDGNTLQQQWVEQNRYERPTQNLRFQGQYFDQETGLHYNRFRYYDPDCGRFVSQDPIGLDGGDNLYQYAPNPIEWIDILGLAKISARTKNKVSEENARFFGRNRCEACGVDTIPAQKSTRGVTPPSNEAQYDHIIPDSKGGANTEDNTQLLCRKCNRSFSDKNKPNFKMLNRILKFLNLGG